MLVFVVFYVVYRNQILCHAAQEIGITVEHQGHTDLYSVNWKRNRF